MLDPRGWKKRMGIGVSGGFVALGTRCPGDWTATLLRAEVKSRCSFSKLMRDLHPCPTKDRL